MGSGVCARHGCGAHLPALTYRGNPRLWCSEPCRVKADRAKRAARGEAYFPRCAVRYSTCAACHGLFVSQYPRPWCAPECRATLRAARARSRYAADPVGHRARVATSRLKPEIAAKAKTTRRAWRDRVGYIDSTRAADQRRRARKAAVPTENIHARDVYERDGWICGICHEPVDAGLAWPDPLSPSLDHVVPLSAGGPHLMSNVRLAHLDCNVRRGAAPDRVLAS